MEDFEAFARLITAIQPWLDQLVIVGGWAHRLHCFHRLARQPDHAPIRTRDTDLAFSPDAVLPGDLRGALLKEGFTEERFGEDAPPATHYCLGEEDQGFYAEFLTPLQGSGLKRNGKPDATMAKAGITAQKMRYLELLLVSPWNVRVDPRTSSSISPDLDLFVPNPTSFIAQKLLIHPDRPPRKRAQDILYIHDTLELFGGSLAELRDLWTTSVRPSMAVKTANRVEALARDVFGRVSDATRDASRIPQDRRPSPEDVQRACEFGLGEILQG